MNPLTDAVVQLHDIARLIEKDIGTGTLSETVRKCADDLNELMKPLGESK
jgi:hypothetical protein